MKVTVEAECEIGGLLATVLVHTRTDFGLGLFTACWLLVSGGSHTGRWLAGARRLIGGYRRVTGAYNPTDAVTDEQHAEAAASLRRILNQSIRNLSACNPLAPEGCGGSTWSDCSVCWPSVARTRTT